MRAVDLIQKKKLGQKHTREEIYTLVEGYTKGEIEDYQMSAWLMAVCFQGLDKEETAYLTEAFVDSGEALDFSSISNFVADKHSTGGVGDKVTIVLIPLLASLGVTCAKLSGRGLGYTGGTVDKLESIPNFKCEMSKDDFMKQIKEINAAISSQSPNLTPADGKIYALRDVTATVDNKSLICASVVSKKIASGANSIVLDVKYGSGAFIKTKEEAQELAKLMIETGALLNRKISAIITSMEQPLGKNIGNSLEIIESIEFLKGNYSQDLYDVTLEIVAKTLMAGGFCKTKEEAKEKIDESIKSKKALEMLRKIISYQGGNPDVVDDYSLFKQAKNKYEIKAQNQGFISDLDALEIAHACKLLGAGRDKKSDSIDFSAGCILSKKISDKVRMGETVLTLYYNDVKEEKLKEAIEHAKNSFKLSNNEVIPPVLIYEG